MGVKLFTYQCWQYSEHHDGIQ